MDNPLLNSLKLVGKTSLITPNVRPLTSEDYSAPWIKNTLRALEDGKELAFHPREGPALPTWSETRTHAVHLLGAMCDERYCVGVAQLVLILVGKGDALGDKRGKRPAAKPEPVDVVQAELFAKLEERAEEGELERTWRAWSLGAHLLPEWLLLATAPGGDKKTKTNPVLSESRTPWLYKVYIEMLMPYQAKMDAQLFVVANATTKATDKATAPEVLVKTLKGLEKQVVSDEQETGANNLYLTLGTVLWTNPDKKEGGSYKLVRSPFLLLPVKLVLGGSGKQPGLVLDQASDGVVVNLCLMEKLRQTFRFSIAAFEDPESWSELYARGGVEGVFKTFLEGVETASIREGLSIELQSSCTLGLLRFGKFRMWLDLRNHWQDFKRNSGLVKHLIESPETVYKQELLPTPEEVETSEAYCPILYDGSQLAAVVAAGKGRSFVLQGPPGTGKSQTIAHMLAHALAKGSRVLFVAEKRAALDVVKSRLHDVGLAPFCLDVHGKSTSQALREQLAASLDVNGQFDQQKYERMRSELAELTGELQQYAEDLHREDAVGFSLWSAHQACLRWPEETPDEVEKVTAIVERFGRLSTGPLLERLLKVEGKSKNLVSKARTSEFGVGDGSPWALSRLTDDKVDGDHIRRCLDGLSAILTADDLADFAEIAGAGGPLTPRALERALELAADLHPISGEAFEAIANEIVNLPIPDESVAVINRGVSLQTLNSLIVRLRDAKAAYFFASSRISEALKQANTVTLLNLEDADQMLDALAAVRAALEALQVLRKRLVAQGATIAVPEMLERELLAAVLRWRASQVLENSETIALAESLAQRTPARREVLSNFRIHWSELYEAVDADEESLARWLGSTALLLRVRECLPSWEDDKREGRFLKLRCWARFLSGLEELRKLGLESLVDGVLQGTIALEKLPSCAPAAIARACRSERLKTLGLLTFHGEEHTSKVDELAKLIEQERELLLEQLPAKLVDVARSIDQPWRLKQLSEELALRRELGLEPRRQVCRSIRALLRDHSTAIAALMPCVLASPDSVAMYLKPSMMSFDLVVFDEASQVTVANAIGAMGRGETVVVAGDSKQMPPSSKSIAATEQEEEGEQEVVKDAKSILEECQVAGLQEVLLSWHYRSEHESLIAFSNKHYYDGRLSSFPAPGGRRESLGITWRKVEDGQVHRDALKKRITNPREAEFIVNEVRLRLSDPDESGRSIGVVALNAAQADLIEKLLEKERASDLDLAKAMDKSKLFVKNLENVQGDERDVIMISITYAPEPGKKFSHGKLGPINNLGGERRWNVLVTRAKQEVVVFSSIEPEDIPEEGLDGKIGARHVRSYLFLARDGDGGGGSGEGGEGSSSGELVGGGGGGGGRSNGMHDLHRAEIAGILRGKRFRVEESVGLSDFKIDLAIAHPDSPEGTWQVAVLLDGPGYKARRTVRDREALPEQVLKGLMKWPCVKRVWLLEWLAERERVIAELVELVESAGPAYAATGGTTDEDEV